MDFEKMKSIIANVLNIDPTGITRETTLVEDLGADSLDVLQVIMEIEEEYGVEIPTEMEDTLVTVGDAYDKIKTVIK